MLKFAACFVAAGDGRRARLGNRYLHQKENGTADVQAKYLSVDMNTALVAKVDECVIGDAQILALPTPAAPVKNLDFTLEREVIQELGAK